jgi:two-component system, chemotaxis family, protein-glutamate methylesterase/glutaminase
VTAPGAAVAGWLPEQPGRRAGTSGTEPRPRLTVLVVEDSATQRRLLRAAAEADGDITVVGEARTGREAVGLVERLRPAVVLLDLDLPVMSGLEAIERIMASWPTPILVCSGFVGGAAGSRALEALAAGAVDVLPLPGSAHTGGPQAYAEALRKRLRVVARVRVITHPRGRLRASGAPAGRLVGQPAGRAAEPSPLAPARRRGPVESARVPVRLLAIGASTGGPQALLTLLGGLPADLEQAVLVVQHMAEGFIPGLAAWLDDLVPLPVVVGESGRRLAPGTVTIAPSGGNLLVRDDRLRVLCEPPLAGQFHVPGIDHTFASIAGALGPAACGVLLTGMGRDGATGLLTMRRRGAVTLGQDEASCAVYGMPGAAAALGAVEHQLPLDRLPGAVLAVVGRDRARPDGGAP